MPVTREGWRAEIPSPAVLGTCVQRYHHSQEQPAPNATQVCGTPYTVDRGSGYAEVVRDCEYQVYADWCRYTVNEWRQVDEALLTGRDRNPSWPSVQLAANQRAGARSELYSVTFESDGESYTYAAADPAEFAQFTKGSRWILKVNTFGDVTTVTPAR